MAPSWNLTSQEMHGIISSQYNNDGIVVGYFKDASLAQHAFMRAVSGEITLLDEPSATVAPVDRGSSIRQMVPSGRISRRENERHGFAWMSR